jgi:hypothetical protein
MRILLFITFGIVLCFSGKGQYFNKSIVFPNSEIQLAWSIDKIAPDSFFVVAANWNLSNTNIGIGTFLINSNGDTLSTNSWVDTTKSLYAGWSNSTTPTKDKGFIMGGGLKDDTMAFGYLVKFNLIGDTLWTKAFGDSMEVYTFSQAIQSSDGGYAAVGEFDTWTIRSDGWLVKTDSLGDIEWEQFYNRSNNSLERLISVQECYDGGYILGGGTQESPQLRSRNYDPLILKVDSLGNVQWWRVYDTPYDDALAYAIQTYDSGFVFSSGVSVSKGSSSYSRAALFKYDQWGNWQWTKMYGPIGFNTGALVVKQLEDSTLIAAGRVGMGTKIKGLLIHAEANGDSIFVETYENDPNGATSQNYLWDVITMDDGGFMASGEVIALPPNVPFRQDAWIIRVDSMGCIIQNCFVGLDENLGFEEETFEIYPNPTKGIVNLRTKESLISIEIFNLQGQKVQEINPEERSWILPAQSNLYLIRFQDIEGNVYTKKVIKK